MGKLFDPHYHTIQSDGDSKILESVDAAKRAGLAALIITDHLNRFGYTDSYRTNKNLVTTLTGPHKPDKYPIIIGMEFGLPPAVGFGEVLIFGTEICQAIQNNLAEINNFDLAEFKKLKDRHKCAIVQCHPNKEATGVDERILQIIDACEITRSGNAHYNYEKILEDCKKKGITPVASSDGHIAYRDSELIYEVQSYLGKAYNIASIDINNEKDLIKVIKENLIEKRVFKKGNEQKDRIYFPQIW